MTVEPTGKDKAIRSLKRTFAAMGAEHITSHRKGAAGAAGPTAAAAAGGQPAPIALEPAFLRGLQTVAVDEYRRNYQRFRKGKAVGAKGERPDPAANLRVRREVRLRAGFHPLYLSDCGRGGSCFAFARGVCRARARRRSWRTCSSWRGTACGCTRRSWSSDSATAGQQAHPHTSALDELPAAGGRAC